MTYLIFRWESSTGEKRHEAKSCCLSSFPNLAFLIFKSLFASLVASLWSPAYSTALMTHCIAISPPYKASSARHSTDSAADHVHESDIPLRPAKPEAVGHPFIPLLELGIGRGNRLDGRGERVVVLGAIVSIGSL